MSDNDAKTVGQIKIADEVIAIIAGTAALEVDGAAPSGGDVSESAGRRNFSKGVKVNMDGDQVRVALSVMVRYGYKINEVTCAVQQKVKTAIETMTALFVSSVDVSVAGVLPEKR